jgi:hypothetical protein
MIPFHDKRSIKVRSICAEYKFIGCRSTCPLSNACKMRTGDNFHRFIKRMNEAAERISKPSGDLSFGKVEGWI